MKTLESPEELAENPLISPITKTEAEALLDEFKGQTQAPLSDHPIHKAIEQFEIEEFYEINGTTIKFAGRESFDSGNPSGFVSVHIHSNDKEKEQKIGYFSFLNEIAGRGSILATAEETRSSGT